LTENKGVDIILDMVAGSYVPRNIEVAAIEGRIIIIGVLGGASENINFLKIMLNRITLSGSTLRARSVEEKSVIANQLKEKIWPMLGTGQIRPQIYKTFPLSDAAEAHRLMERSEHIGKIVLQI
jgi:NADPH2:quinone reductase